MAEQPDITLSQTVKQYSRQLLAFIKGRVTAADDAEDILQEVWYQLSRLTNLSELESISGWLYSVTRNKITDLYRKKKPASLDEDWEDEEDSIRLKEILLLDDSGNAELMLMKEHFWAELRQGLSELPQNQREVFVLNEIEDMTLQQIADMQGEKIKTVISRKGYAVKHLRKKLHPLYIELNA